MVGKMDKTLVINAVGKTDVLPRIFGIIRRLNFVFDKVIITRNQNSTYEIIIIIKESNNKLTFEYLEKQLEKIVDVIKVSRLPGNQVS
jgi:acetolactate synthase small subunit